MRLGDRPVRGRPSRTGVDWNDQKVISLRVELESPVAHGRGLEPSICWVRVALMPVARRARAWIGTVTQSYEVLTAERRPSRTGVDWNPMNGAHWFRLTASPVAHGRGLELAMHARREAGERVARRARAWIGTRAQAPVFGMSARRPSRTGVDWNKTFAASAPSLFTSPVAHGRGLEHVVGPRQERPGRVARRARAWIGTDAGLPAYAAAGCRPSRTGVDWNSPKAAEIMARKVARRARAWIGTLARSGGDRPS